MGNPMAKFKRSLLVTIIAILSTSISAYAGDAAFGTIGPGAYLGNQQAGMQQMCRNALNNYLNRAGPPPPAACQTANTPTLPNRSKVTQLTPQTSCLPFGNGGTRCTTLVPGHPPSATTCLPLGNGKMACTTQ